AVRPRGNEITLVQVTGDIGHSLVQAGISGGSDGVFGASPAAKDADETSRMATIAKVTAGSVTGSVLAAGGVFSSLTVTGAMTDSTAVSGLSLGSAAIAAVLADGTPLVGAAEMKAALTGADRT